MNESKRLWNTFHPTYLSLVDRFVDWNHLLRYDEPSREADVKSLVRDGFIEAFTWHDGRLYGAVDELAILAEGGRELLPFVSQSSWKEGLEAAIVGDVEALDRIDPPLGFLQRAILLARMNHPALARVALESAEKQPVDEEKLEPLQTQFDLMRTRFHLGLDPTDWLVRMEQARHSDIVPGRSALSSMWVKLGNSERGRLVLEQAGLDFPWQVADAGEGYLRTFGDEAAARALLAKARNTDSSYMAQRAHHLAPLYRVLGDDEAARGCIDQSVNQGEWDDRLEAADSSKRVFFDVSRAAQILKLVEDDTGVDGAWHRLTSEWREICDDREAVRRCFDKQIQLDDLQDVFEDLAYAIGHDEAKAAFIDAAGRLRRVGSLCVAARCLARCGSRNEADSALTRAMAHANSTQDWLQMARIWGEDPFKTPVHVKECGTRAEEAAASCSEWLSITEFWKAQADEPRAVAAIRRAATMSRPDVHYCSSAFQQAALHCYSTKWKEGAHELWQMASDSGAEQVQHTIFAIHTLGKIPGIDQDRIRQLIHKVIAGQVPVADRVQLAMLLGRHGDEKLGDILTATESSARSFNEWMWIAQGWKEAGNESEHRRILVKAEGMATTVDDMLKLAQEWNDVANEKVRVKQLLENASSLILAALRRTKGEMSAPEPSRWTVENIAKNWVTLLGQHEDAERFLVEVVRSLKTFSEVKSLLRSSARIEGFGNRINGLLSAAEEAANRSSYPQSAWQDLRDLHETLQSDGTARGRFLLHAVERFRTFDVGMGFLDWASGLRLDAQVLEPAILALERRAKTAQDWSRLAEFWIRPMANRAGFDRCIAKAERKAGNSFVGGSKSHVAVANAWWKSVGDKRLAERWLLRAEANATDCDDWIEICRAWAQIAPDDPSASAVLKQAQFDAFNCADWVAIARAALDIVHDEGLARNALLQAERQAICQADCSDIAKVWDDLDKSQAPALRARMAGCASERWPWLVVKKAIEEPGRLVLLGRALSLVANLGLTAITLLLLLFGVGALVTIASYAGILTLETTPPTLSELIFWAMLTLFWGGPVSLVTDVLGTSLARWARRRNLRGAARLREVDMAPLIWRPLSIIALVGAAPIFTIAVYWWIPTALTVANGSGAHLYHWTCVFVTSGSCNPEGSIIKALGGIPAYSPDVLWWSLGLFLLGIIVRLRFPMPPKYRAALAKAR